VDAVNGERQLESQWEARKQVALADRLLVTKTDLPEGRSGLAVLTAALEAINPHAERVLDGTGDLAAWLQPRRGGEDVRRAVEVLAGARPIGPLHGDVRSFVLGANVPLDWLRLQAWLEALRAREGERLLRLKGVVRVVDEAAPLVLHGVHHLFHPPLAAPQLRWPASESALVLIGRGLDVTALRAGFGACIAAAPAAAAAPESVPSSPA
jgi:G3E family GTPase